MARETIDPDVYFAYGKSLMSTKNFKDAPVFFALGLRYDPFNVEALIQTAKCTADTDSLGHAVSMLEDEFKRSNGSRAEYLTAIAQLQIQKGAWDKAQEYVNQAMSVNPDHAFAWKLQAEIAMNRESFDTRALTQALDAYKSFSDRNPSDPTGYLERYKIFAKRSQFDKAKDELQRIYEIYPKYPNLHYYLGILYSVQGNHVVAIQELTLELRNNPNSTLTLLALGKEFLEVGNAPDALKLFTKVMQQAPGSADAKQNAGWANYKLKNYTAAVALLTAALHIEQGNPLLHKRMGIVYKDMADYANACASFRKYLEMEPDAPDKAEFKSCF